MFHSISGCFTKKMVIKKHKNLGLPDPPPHLGLKVLIFFGGFPNKLASIEWYLIRQMILLLKKTEMEFALLHKLLTLQEVGLGD